MKPEKKASNHDREEEEARICVFAENLEEGHSWYMIDKHHSKISSEEEPLSPAFKLKHEKLTTPVSAAVGSALYAFGGSAMIGSYELTLNNTVCCIVDSGNPNSKLVEIAPIKSPRIAATPFAANNKLYVVGGVMLSDAGDIPPPVAYYDPTRKEWSDLKPLDITDIERCAVFPTGDKVMLYSVAGNYVVGHSVNMYCYDVKSNTCSVYCENFLPAPRAFTVLGGLLITASHLNKKRQLVLQGYDAYDKNAHDPVPVVGLQELFEEEDKEHKNFVMPWEDSWLSPAVWMLTIGKAKIALLWTEVHYLHEKIYCLKINISKKMLPDGKFELLADSGSFSVHKLIGCFEFCSIFPIFASHSC